MTESRDLCAPRVDRPGLVALTGGLFLLVFALLRGNDEGWGSATIVAAFGGAALLLGAFVAVEARVARPMLPLGFFRNPSFPGLQVAAFGISASLFAMWLYMTIYLQQILGLSAIEAGLVYLPGTLLNFAVAGATGSIGQHVSARVLMAGGLALIATGLALLTVLDVDSSRWLFLPGLLVAMVGTGMFNPAVSQVALSSAPPEQSGLAAGVNDMFRNAEIAVGVRGSARSCRRARRSGTARRSPTWTASTMRSGSGRSLRRRRGPLWTRVARLTGPRLSVHRM